MERILTTQEATVQTVHVEIQALKVGKKQVTQALFRQLPYEDLLDTDTVQLRGVPWGHVRYWWEGDGSIFEQGPRLHIVWQRGNELRRAAVYERPDRGHMADYRQTIQDAVDDWFLLRLMTAKHFEGREHYTVMSKPDVKLEGHPVHLGFDTAALRVINDYWEARDYDPQKAAEEQVVFWTQQAGGRPTPEQMATELTRRYAACQNHKQHALDAYSALLAARGLQQEWLPSMLEQHVKQLHAERDEYKARWAQQWQVLSALPQLFIAV
jgi:hypothetical protein